MATNSVNDYLWCVPLPPAGQLGRAVSIWPRCCSSRAVAEEETTLSPPADQAVTGDEEGFTEAPPADQAAIVEEETTSADHLLY
jgi:hypothetical protein